MTIYKCTKCDEFIPEWEVRGTVDDYRHWSSIKQILCGPVQKKEYEWSYCLHCRVWTIHCPTCNNNGCNGGYGTIATYHPDTQLTDERVCPDCPDSYEVEQAEIGMPRGLRSAFGIAIEWIKGRGRLIVHFIHHGTFSFWKKDRWNI